jgi:hypothetical protein
MAVLVLLLIFLVRAQLTPEVAVAVQTIEEIMVVLLELAALEAGAVG